MLKAVFFIKKDINKGGNQMLTESEFNIIKTLIEEEMGYVITSAKCENSNILSKYSMTLTQIVEKLRFCSNADLSNSDKMPLSV